MPYASTLSATEKALLGNPKSIFDDQGFYLYRNERLISWGSWMKMGIRSELNKLARIQVDIPSTLDSVWMLDVKKSSAKIPDLIKDRIRAAVEDSIVRSRRTVRFPGVKEQLKECKVWERINEHEGKIRYQINRETPVIAALYDSIDEKEKQLLDVVLSQIENYIPKYSIANDSMDALSIVNADTNTEEQELMDEVIQILARWDGDKKKMMFERIFRAEAYQMLITKKEQIRKEVFGDDQ